MHVLLLLSTLYFCLFFETRLVFASHAKLVLIANWSGSPTQQGALWSSPHDLACQLSLDYIRSFLHACGTVLDPASVRELFYFDQSELLAKLDREAVTHRAFADSNSNMGAEYGGSGSASGSSSSGGDGIKGGSSESSVAMAPLWSAENRPFVTQRAAHSCVVCESLHSGAWHLYRLGPYVPTYRFRFFMF